MSAPRQGPPLLLLGLGLAALFALSVFVGRYPAPFFMPPSLLGQDEIAWRLVVALRLPRLVAAVVLGATLAAAGLTMQMVFRNPLVEPGFLGVSQGAAFGAAIGIVALGVAFQAYAQLGPDAPVTRIAQADAPPPPPPPPPPPGPGGPMPSLPLPPAQGRRSQC